MIGVSTSNVQPAITRLSTETVLQVCVLILVILCATQLTFVKGMFKPNPWLVSPPGSQIADIPIPDETGYAALSPFLHQQGRSIERVLGDGNCLFRSLSHQLTGTQDHHLILRKTITKFEQSYYGMFQQLHNTINRTPFSSHIKNMKKTCIWGTTVEIIAMHCYSFPSRHLHCNGLLQPRANMAKIYSKEHSRSTTKCYDCI